jgi:glycerophosphoryl diester phosphodiesterase
MNTNYREKRGPASLDLYGDLFMNRASAWKTLAVLAATTWLAQGCATTSRQPVFDRFLVVAHRGVVTEELQENSLASLEETIQRGYTHIEVDVRSTRDGHPVCLHDASLQRTCGIDARIEDLTLAQVRDRIEAERLPAFAEFCARCEGRIDLMPDMKGCPEEVFDAFMQRVDDAMTRHGLVEGALFIGHKRCAERFQGRARLSWRGKPGNARRYGLHKAPNEWFVFGHGNDFDAGSVAAFHAMGLPVVVSINVNHYRRGDSIARGLADIRRMIDCGVDGLQIDSVYETAAMAGRQP